MSTLTERVALALDEPFLTEQAERRALAAIREVLAAIREASPRVRHMVRNIIETQVGPIPLDASVRLTIEELVDAFAREHRLDPPPAEEQQP